mgnify:CR=1 FL=1
MVLGELLLGEEDGAAPVLSPRVRRATVSYVPGQGGGLASGLLASGGEIHVTLAHGPPYDSWDCVLIAKLAGLRVRRCVPFEAARFAGYAHRRTLGDDHAGDAKTAERKSKTYAFGVAGDEPEPTEKERKGSKGIQKQRRGPNVKKSRDDERFLKRMRGGR